MVWRDGKILLGLRKGGHGDGTWHLPGGHLEWQETFEECAIREVSEETGVSISNVRKLTFTNDIYLNEKKHYISLFLTADWVAGEAELREPDRCSGWKWFAWEDLPHPLFVPMQQLVESGYDPRL